MYDYPIEGTSFVTEAGLGNNWQPGVIRFFSSWVCYSTQRLFLSSIIPTQLSAHKNASIITLSSEAILCMKWSTSRLVLFSISNQSESET